MGGVILASPFSWLFGGGSSPSPSPSPNPSQSSSVGVSIDPSPSPAAAEASSTSYQSHRFVFIKNVSESLTPLDITKTSMVVQPALDQVAVSEEVETGTSVKVDTVAQQAFESSGGQLTVNVDVGEPEVNCLEPLIASESIVAHNVTQGANITLYNTTNSTGAVSSDAQFSNLEVLQATISANASAVISSVSKLRFGLSVASTAVLSASALYTAYRMGKESFKSFQQRKSVPLRPVLYSLLSAVSGSVGIYTVCQVAAKALSPTVIPFTALV